MAVKWRNTVSSVKHNIKWGPQGSSIGILDFIAQSNDNLDMVPEEDKFKFIDDNTITDVIDVKKIGMASYNVKQHVPNDVPSHNQIIPNESLRST